MSIIGRAWAGVTGAARWISCQPVAAGVAEQRASICRQCPSVVPMRVRGTVLAAGFCGDPLASTSKTCGCLVLWANDGGKPDTAAGKVTCSGEKCPQGRW